MLCHVKMRWREAKKKKNNTEICSLLFDSCRGKEKKKIKNDHISWSEEMDRIWINIAANSGSSFDLIVVFVLDHTAQQPNIFSWLMADHFFELAKHQTLSLRNDTERRNTHTWTKKNNIDAFIEIYPLAGWWWEGEINVRAKLNTTTKKSNNNSTTSHTKTHHSVFSPKWNTHSHKMTKKVQQKKKKLWINWQKKSGQICSRKHSILHSVLRPSRCFVCAPNNQWNQTQQ